MWHVLIYSFIKCFAHIIYSGKGSDLVLLKERCVYVLFNINYLLVLLWVWVVMV